MGKSRNWLVDQATRAAEAGHNLDLVPVSVRFTRGGRVVPDSAGGVQGRCSCGWEGRPRPTKRGALASATVHLGELAAEGFPQADTPPADRVKVLPSAASGL